MILYNLNFEGTNTMTNVADHYDKLIDEDNDPFRDPATLKEYMDKWDGKQFIDLLKLSPDKNVLEIGIGTGRLACRVASRCKSLTGIDISPKTIARAKENLSSFDNISYICADFLTYDFTEKYDIIYSSLTFMHISQKEPAIRKAVNLLNSNGRLAVSIDKNRSDCIDFGDRRLKVYPDDPDKIKEYFKSAGIALDTIVETEFAYLIYGDKTTIKF